MDPFPDEESATEIEEDESTECDGVVDPWAILVEDAKEAVRPEYDGKVKNDANRWARRKCGEAI